jgi:hypothetical protein
MMHQVAQGERNQDQGGSPSLKGRNLASIQFERLMLALASGAGVCCLSKREREHPHLSLSSHTYVSLFSR